jgi:hypothetical protein
MQDRRTAANQGLGGAALKSPYTNFAQHDNMVASRNTVVGPEDQPPKVRFGSPPGHHAVYNVQQVKVQSFCYALPLPAHLPSATLSPPSPVQQNVCRQVRTRLNVERNGK